MGLFLTLSSGATWEHCLSSVKRNEQVKWGSYSSPVVSDTQNLTTQSQFQQTVETIPLNVAKQSKGKGSDHRFAAGPQGMLAALAAKSAH